MHRQHTCSFHCVNLEWSFQKGKNASVVTVEIAIPLPSFWGKQDFLCQVTHHSFLVGLHRIRPFYPMQTQDRKSGSMARTEVAVGHLLYKNKVLTTAP